MTTLVPRHRAWSSRKAMSRSAAMPASSRTRTWCSGQVHPVVLQPPPEGGQGPGLGKPGLLAQGPGRLARGRGADHGEAVPISKASRTAAMTVVLPEPATPSTSSTPRPEVAIPMTAACCPGVSGDPRTARWRPSATARHLGRHSGCPQVLHTPLHSLFDEPFGGETWAVA